MSPQRGLASSDLAALVLQSNRPVTYAGQAQYRVARDFLSKQTTKESDWC
jgi:hypothetical protein